MWVLRWAITSARLRSRLRVTGSRRRVDREGLFGPIGQHQALPHRLDRSCAFGPRPGSLFRFEFRYGSVKVCNGLLLRSEASPLPFVSRYRVATLCELFLQLHELRLRLTAVCRAYNAWSCMTSRFSASSSRCSRSS
jgi:hypothetical protein